MKALKVVLVAVLVSLTMMGMAQKVRKDHPTFHSRMIPITAIDVQTELGKTILIQVDQSLFLTGSEHNGVYVASVRLNGRIYKLFGTYMQWFRFLKIHPSPMPSEKANKEDRKIR